MKSPIKKNQNNQIGVQSNGQTETFPMTKQGFEAANKTFKNAEKPRVFKLLTVLMLVLFTVSLSAQSQGQMPPCKFGKCDTLPEVIAPVSLDAMTYGDKIRYYCIVELVTVEMFAQLCTDRLKEKEPIGELRSVIDEILKPRPYKEEGKTKMDF